MEQRRTGATATPPKSTPPPAPAGGQGDAATAQDVAREAREAASGVAQDVAEEVQRRTTARLEKQVGRAAERLGGVSQAMQAVGRHLREQDDPAMAQWADRAADQVDRFSGYLRGKDLDELVYEGERFARRQPALFLGGAFVLGLVAARFLKSSGQRDERYGYRPDWPTYYGQPSGAPREYAPPRYGATGGYGDATAPPPPSTPRAGAGPRMTGSGIPVTGTTGTGTKGTGTSGTGSDGSAGAAGHTGTRHPGAPVDPL